MKNSLNSLFNIRDKWIVITGANGFFGRHFSKVFLELGAKVILLSRSPELLKTAVQYRREHGKDRVLDYRVDFYQLNKLEKTLKIVAKKQCIDVLVNNACDLSPQTGFNTSAGLLEKSSYKQWKYAFESGLYWAALTTQIFGKKFKKKKKGNIINVSSMYGLVAPDPKMYEGTQLFNPASYGVNKDGLLALTRYTASFWGEHGIRCNALVPGAFPNTVKKSSNQVKGKSKSAFMKRLKDKTALKRVGQLNDLSGALIYLASDASAYMTGQTLVVDGGWTIR